jgi:hypothetical protein
MKKALISFITSVLLIAISLDASAFCNANSWEGRFAVTYEEGRNTMLSTLQAPLHASGYIDILHRSDNLANTSYCTLSIVERSSNYFPGNVPGQLIPIGACTVITNPITCSATLSVQVRAAGISTSVWGDYFTTLFPRDLTADPASASIRADVNSGSGTLLVSHVWGTLKGNTSAILRLERQLKL